MKRKSLLRRGALPIVLAAVLSACASTGGLAPTVTPLDAANLTASDSLGARTPDAEWPASNWWTSAGDRELDALVAEALSANPNLALVDARVRLALAAADAADAARKPSLNAGASVSGARVPPMLPPIANGHFGVIRYGYLSFKWNLDPWGGDRAKWQAAVGSARAAAVDADAARLQLAGNVVQAWYGLAGARAQRDLAQAELSRADDFLKLTRERVDSGIDSRFSLARIEAEVAADRAQLTAADNAVHTAALVLTALAGAGPDRAHDFAPRIPDSVRQLDLPSDLPADLLGRRPDVIAARWRVEAAGHSVKAAKAAFLPNLGISSLAGLIAPSSIDLFSLKNRFYTVAPAISLPIFEGGALRANLAARDAERDIAVAQYNQVLVQAINQVAARADDLRSLAAEERDASAARDSADKAWELAMQRYRAGVGSFLESLSVRQELIAAERNLAGIRTRRIQAWAALNVALGGGFKPAADAPALATTDTRPHATTKAQP